MSPVSHLNVLKIHTALVICFPVVVNGVNYFALFVWFFFFGPLIRNDTNESAFGGKQQLFIEMKLKRTSTRSIALL